MALLTVRLYGDPVLRQVATPVRAITAEIKQIITDMTETMWGPPDEQVWTPVQAITTAVLRFARGELDALRGRFVHAARDDLDALLAAAGQIADRDARTLRLRPYAEDDPLG